VRVNTMARCTPEIESFIERFRGTDVRLFLDARLFAIEII
jgi:hypothetical protein